MLASTFEQSQTLKRYNPRRKKTIDYRYSFIKRDNRNVVCENAINENK